MTPKNVCAASEAERLTAQEIERQLDRILSSELFRGAERLGAILRFAVRSVLDGEADQLKETSIALKVFGRSSFDPASDSIVRSAVRRLRERLGRYYQTDGKADRIFISIPVGSYVPEFVSHSDNTAACGGGFSAD